jgi:hypothetical protein
MPFATQRTVRDCDCVAQAHSLNSPVSQLATQGLALQVCMELGATSAHIDAGTEALDASTQLTVRVCVPPPQATEHSLHALEFQCPS